jgi:hypothetical protein
MTDLAALAVAFALGALIVAALWRRSARGWQRRVEQQLAAIRAAVARLEKRHG